jgi:hypothetical protein
MRELVIALAQSTLPSYPNVRIRAKPPHRYSRANTIASRPSAAGRGSARQIW